MSLLRIKSSTLCFLNRCLLVKNLPAFQSTLQCLEVFSAILYDPNQKRNQMWLRNTTWNFSNICNYSTSHSFIDGENFDEQLEQEPFQLDGYEIEGQAENDFTAQDIIFPSGEGKRYAVTDLPAHHLRKKSSFLFNYIQTCISTGFVEQAVHAVLLRKQVLNQDMKTFEYLFQSLLNFPKSSNQNDLDVMDCIRLLFHHALQSGLTLSPNACACVLAAMHKYSEDDLTLKKMALKVEDLYSLKECLNSCHKDGQAYQYFRSAVLYLMPDFVFQNDKTSVEVPRSALQDLSACAAQSNNSIHLPDDVTVEDMMKRYDEQLSREVNAPVSVPNILSTGQPRSWRQQRQIKKLKDLHERWHAVALRTLQTVKDQEKRRWLDRRSHELGVYPFLCTLPDQVYIDIIINHLSNMPKTGEITINTAAAIGRTVYSRYSLKQFLTGETRKRLQNIYKDYLSAYTEKCSAPILRESWIKLEQKHGCVQQEGHIAPWENLWKILVGKKLLEVMVSSLTVAVGIDNTHVPSAYFKDIPAVFNSYKPFGNRMYGMTIPHPVYANLVESAHSDFMFQPEHLPMVVPPLPWLHPNQGGFLSIPTDFIRKKYYSDLMRSDKNDADDDNLSAVADSLNVLSSVAWKTNKRVLDVQLRVFKGSGDEKLKIAPKPKEVPPHLKGSRYAPPDERKQIAREYYKAKKHRNEMHSLHCDALYKFSIANFCRDKLIWLPHNLDFRGRTYPTPPHFNYMGDDVSRSIFMFADGRRLGKRGLEWLKIHLVNLTGVKKYGNLKDRLDYADQMMDEILDSADHPLDGRCWWKLSEEPWQTLAACMELADAVRSPDPESYISHLPIYQDGSCNGLQHYAAIGRDAVGARQVNLDPSDLPQDVYTGVAEIVEDLRCQDAMDGVDLARHLDGFITRKVVKQTVMTSVYGVTRFGGALQIKKQLQNLDDFPSDNYLEASIYLVNAIFRSISTIFTSATNIQKWLTDIAHCMAKGGKAVEWRTPLGLLAVQPYFKSASYPVDSPLQQLRVAASLPSPNVAKQCNAFAPNFVHSLDSTHMMLTATSCYSAGVKFSAVHDCYWSHASSVDDMNKLCREEFIKLHSLPILQQLAQHLMQYATNRDDDDVISSPHRERLRHLLENIPERGDFDLNKVKLSTFFFS